MFYSKPIFFCFIYIYPHLWKYHSGKFVSSARTKSWTSWQWQFHYRKYYVNHCFSIVWKPSTEHCQKRLMHLDCPYQNWGKILFCTCQIHSGSLSIISNKLAVTVSLWKILWKSLFLFVWQVSVKHCLKMLINLDCAYQNWGETLHCTCQNTFLEAFLKFRTNWQWQLHYGKYYGNHCFSILWQPSIKIA